MSGLDCRRGAEETLTRLCPDLAQAQGGRPVAGFLLGKPRRHLRSKDKRATSAQLLSAAREKETLQLVYYGQVTPVLAWNGLRLGSIVTPI